MNQTLRYEVILYWSTADDSFIAEVPELAGCAADGATYQEALTNAETIIQEWLATARESGPSARNRRASGGVADRPSRQCAGSPDQLRRRCHPGLACDGRPGFGCIEFAMILDIHLRFSGTMHSWNVANGASRQAR